MNGDLYNIVRPTIGNTTMGHGPAPGSLQVAANFAQLSPKISSNPVAGYPNVGYGQSLWGGRDAATPPLSLPMQVSHLPEPTWALTDYGLRSGQTEFPIDIAYDLWLSAAPAPRNASNLPGASAGDVEVMAWVYNDGSHAPAGHRIASLNLPTWVNGRDVSTTQWTVFVCPASQCVAWPVVSFVFGYGSGVAGGSVGVDLRALLTDISSTPPLSSYYLDQISLGAEFGYKSASGFAWDVSDYCYLFATTSPPAQACPAAGQAAASTSSIGALPPACQDAGAVSLPAITTGVPNEPEPVCVQPNSNGYAWLVAADNAVVAARTGVYGNNASFVPPMTMRGITYSHGVAVNSEYDDSALPDSGNSQVLVYSLAGNYGSFSALVGLDDAVNRGPMEAQFFRDGTLVASVLVHPGDSPKSVSFALQGAQVLTIQVSDLAGLPFGSGYSPGQMDIVVPSSATAPTPSLAASPSPTPRPSASISPTPRASTEWPMSRFNPNHSGFNPFETVLSTSNVSGLRLTWTYTPGPNGVFISSPAVVNGMLYVGDIVNHKVHALNASTGALLWSFITGGAVSSSPAVVNGVVYVGSEDHKVYALDASTGALDWSYTTGGAVTSSPAVVNSVVYIGSLDDKVYALNASTGALDWSYTTGGEVFSSPALGNGLVYVGSDDHKVYALDAITGAVDWSFTTGNNVDSSPAVVNEIVYVGSNDNKVYALNGRTGAVLWSFTTDKAVGYSSPAVANGVVYVGSIDRVYALNASDGSLDWSYLIVDGSGIDSPAVANGVVYVGSAYGIFKGRAYALDASTGVLVWSHDMAYTVNASPAVVNGVVYFESAPGVYAFNLG